MPRSPIIRFFVVFLSLSFGSIISATTIELQMTGQITSSTFASVPVGTTVTADLFYDPTTAASFSGGDLCRVPATTTTILGLR
jgi:hypothetical protein